MAIPGWSDVESPFHAGELAIQARLGVKERMDQQGRRMIRSFLPDQHRQFFAQLPYIIAGTVDAAGNPWASILVGEPGFISSPDDRTLQVAAQPLFGDPLGVNLAEGIDIGLLGIELHTRRRNRVNGVIAKTSSDGFEVSVRQSFGNCPQYIQSRMYEFRTLDPTLSKPIHSITAFSDPERAMIAASDTFLIATAYQAEAAGKSGGVDVSHRGGKPGFVQIEDDRTLMIPDFSGNSHFNTFGNLELNPRAGLLFMDFEQGHLLYLTGKAEVIWQGAEIKNYAGAERLLRFQVQQGYRVEGSLPWRWSAPEFSPFLQDTGPWQLIEPEKTVEEGRSH